VKSNAWLAYGLLALVLLHAGAALHHGWVRRDGLLARMGFGRRRAELSASASASASASESAAPRPAAPEAD
jgi:cytochrome b561